MATGYNGPPAGYSLATDGRPCSAWCSRHDTPESAPDFSDCPSVHAELNALLYSDRERRLGGTAYLTRDPCWACAVALAASGINRVVTRLTAWEATYRSRQVAAYLEDCGVQVCYWWPGDVLIRPRVGS